MAKLGIICTVFNDVSYLKTMWRSLKNIDFKDVNYYFVDDFSTKNIDNAFDEIANCPDRKVHILKNDDEQRGFGAGCARNYALDLADDEYVAFVDADDIVSPTYHSKLIQISDIYQLDCVKTGWTVVNYTKRTSVNLEENIVTNTVLAGREFFKPFYKSNLYDKPHSWAGIYKKSFLDNKGIRFSSLFTAEDRLFWTKCLCESQKIMAIPVVDGYLYRKEGDDRLTTTGNIIQNDYFRAGVEIVNYLKKTNASKDVWRKVITQLIAIIDFHYQRRNRLSAIAAYDFCVKVHKLLKLLELCPEYEFIYTRLSDKRKNIVNEFNEETLYVVE